MSVSVVPDGGKDRNGQAGYGGAEVIIVKAGKVQRGASPTQDEHGVGSLGKGLYVVKGADYRARGTVALHCGRKQHGIESEAPFVFKQVAAKVAVTGGIGCGHDCQKIWDRGQGKLFLQIGEAFFLEALDGLAAAQFGLAQGVLHINVFNYQGQAVELAVIDPHLEHQRHTGSQGAARGLGEAGGKDIEAGTPDNGPCFCHRPSEAALAKFKITMAVGFVLQRSNLRLHTYRPRDGFLNPFLNNLLQFQQLQIIPI